MTARRKSVCAGLGHMWSRLNAGPVCDAERQRGGIYGISAEFLLFAFMH